MAELAPLEDGVLYKLINGNGMGSGVLLEAWLKRMLSKASAHNDETYRLRLLGPNMFLFDLRRFPRLTGVSVEPWTDRSLSSSVENVRDGVDDAERGVK